MAQAQATRPDISAALWGRVFFNGPAEYLLVGGGLSLITVFAVLLLTDGHAYATTAMFATVILITVVWTMTSLLFYGLLREGTARLVVLGIFGLFGAQEVHHVIESFQTGAYDPGVVTCVPYSVLGVLLLSAVWREHKRGSAVASDDSSRLTFDRRPGVSYEGR